VKLPKMKCQKCGFDWVPRVEKPSNCPRCRFRIWTLRKEVNNEVVYTEGNEPTLSNKNDLKD